MKNTMLKGFLIAAAGILPLPAISQVNATPKATETRPATEPKLSATQREEELRQEVKKLKDRLDLLGETLSTRMASAEAGLKTLDKSIDTLKWANTTDNTKEKISTLETQSRELRGLIQSMAGSSKPKTPDATPTPPTVSPELLRRLTETESAIKSLQKSVDDGKKSGLTEKVAALDKLSAEFSQQIKNLQQEQAARQQEAKTQASKEQASKKAAEKEKTLKEKPLKDPVPALEKRLAESEKTLRDLEKLTEQIQEKISKNPEPKPAAAAPNDLKGATALSNKRAESTEKSVEALKASLGETTKALEKAQNDLAKSGQAQETLKAELKQALTRLNQLEAQTLRVERQLKDVVQKNGGDIYGGGTKLTAETKVVRPDSAAQVQKALQDLQTLQENVLKDVSKAKNDLALLQVDHSTAIKALKERLDRTTAQIEENDKALKSKIEEVSTRQASLDQQTQKSIKEVQEKFATLEKNQKPSSEKPQEALAQSKAISEKADKALQLASGFQSKSETLEKALQESSASTRKSLGELDQAVKALQSEGKTTQEKLEQYQKGLAKAEQAIQSIVKSEDLAKALEGLAKAEDLNSATKGFAKTQDLDAAVKKSNEALETLKTSTATSLSEQTAKLAALVTELGKAKTELGTEVSALKESHAKSTANQEALSNQVKQSTESLAKVKESADGAQKSITTIKDDLQTEFLKTISEKVSPLVQQVDEHRISLASQSAEAKKQVERLASLESKTQETEKTLGTVQQNLPGLITKELDGKIAPIRKEVEEQAILVRKNVEDQVLVIKKEVGENLETLRKENSEGKKQADRLDSLSQSNESHQKALIALQGDLGDLKTKWAGSETQFKNQAEKLAALEKTLNESASNPDDKSPSLKAQSEKISTLEKDLHDFRQQLTGIVETARKGDPRIDTLTEKASTLQKNLAEVDKAIKASDADRTKTETDLRNKLQSVEQNQLSSQAKTRELETKLGKMSESNQSLDSLKADVESTRLNLNKTIPLVDKIKRDLSDEQSQNQSRFSTLESDLAKLRGLDGQIAKLNNSTGSVSTLKEQMEESSKLLQKLQKDLQAEVTRLSSEDKNQKAALAPLEEELKRVKETIQVMAQARTTPINSDEHLSKIQDQLNSLEILVEAKGFSNLFEKVNALEKSLKEIKGKLNASHSPRSSDSVEADLVRLGKNLEAQNQLLQQLLRDQKSLQEVQQKRWQETEQHYLQIRQRLLLLESGGKDKLAGSVDEDDLTVGERIKKWSDSIRARTADGF